MKRIYGRTDTTSYREATSHLKRKVIDENGEVMEAEEVEKLRKDK